MLYRPQMNEGSVKGRVAASRRIAFAALLALGCGALPRAPTESRPPPAQRAAVPSPSVPTGNAQTTKTPCTRAAMLRAAVPTLREAGTLAHALRNLDRADALCPVSARNSQALLVETTRELGLLSRSRSLATALAETPDATSDERRIASRTLGLGVDADFGSGQTSGALAALVCAALSQGSSTEARRSLSRALVALERAERAPLVADVVAWAPGRSSSNFASLSSDGTRIALRGADVRPAYVSRSDADELITVIDTRTWQTLVRVRLRRKILEPSHSPIAGMMDIGPHSLLMVDDDSVVHSFNLDTGEVKTASAGWKPERGLAACADSFGESRTAALSAQADLLAFAQLSGGIEVHRASSGERLQTIPAPGKIGSFGDVEGPHTPCRISGATLLRFSPDGSTLVFTTPGRELQSWQLGTKHARLLGTLSAEPAALSYSSNGSKLAVTTSQYPPTRAEIFELNSVHRSVALALPRAFGAGMGAFSGSAITSVGQNELLLIDIDGTPSVRTLPWHGTDAAGCAFNAPDGRTFVIDADSVHTFDRTSGADMVTMRLGPQKFAWTAAVAVSATSQAVAVLTVNSDTWEGSLLIARANGEALLHVPLSHFDRYALQATPARLVDFDASGRYVAVLDGAAVILVEAASGRHTSLPVPEQANVFSFAPSGDLLAVAGARGGVQLWDTARALRKTTLETSAIAIRALAWSFDGKRLVYGSDAGNVRVLDPNTEQPVTPVLKLVSGRAIAALTFDRAGNKLYAFGGDLSERAWDLAHGAQPLPASPQTSLAAFGDARFPIMWRKSSAEPEAEASIDYCPTAHSCGSASCLNIWESFPSVTAGCRVEGHAISWQAWIGSTLHAEERVEVTPVEDSQALYLRGSSPEVQAGKTEGGSVIRLLSGEVATVEDSSWGVFSSVEALGQDSRLECRVGRWVFPVEACRDLLVRPSLLHDAKTGDPGYRDE